MRHGPIWMQVADNDEQSTCMWYTYSQTQDSELRTKMACIRVFKAFAVLILFQSNVVSAYWRLACSVSQEERIDPILSPGQVSSHVHKFAGGISEFRSSIKQPVLICQTSDHPQRVPLCNNRLVQHARYKPTNRHTGHLLCIINDPMALSNLYRMME